MNLYFLVEGQKTEEKLYSAWIGHLLPFMRRVMFFDDVLENWSYYILRAGGWPGLVDHTLPNAIDEVNACKKYDRLVVCFDADDAETGERSQYITDKMTALNKSLQGTCKLVTICQTRCIESWLLGHRKMVPTNPSDKQLAEWKRFYDVRNKDPERMVMPYGYQGSIGDFHFEYLRKVFKEKNYTYSKSNPGIARNSDYLQELKARVQAKPKEMQSFQFFLSLVQEVQAAYDSPR